MCNHIFLCRCRWTLTVMSVVLWIWLVTFSSVLINLFLNWHPFEKQLCRINRPVSYLTHAQIAYRLFFLCVWPATWIRTAICCSHCTLQQREVSAWWLFQWGELFDKNKLRAVVVSSSESLLGFQAHSWMFLHLPVRDCCDMGTGDETGLTRHTNTALHSRPCVQLVGMTQDAQGFIESCWGCCASQGMCSGEAQPAGQQRRAGRCNAGRLADAVVLCRPVCCVCECREMRPGRPSSLSKSHQTQWTLRRKRATDKDSIPLNPQVMFGTPSFPGLLKKRCLCFLSAWFSITCPGSRIISHRKSCFTSNWSLRGHSCKQAYTVLLEAQCVWGTVVLSTKFWHNSVERYQSTFVI